MSSSSSHPVDFEQVYGNIFTKSSPRSSYAHCISEDLALGKGIALEFRKRYGGLQTMKEQSKSVGEVATIEIQPPCPLFGSTQNRRFVFGLITKQCYWMKPTLLSLKMALENLRLECDKLGVTELSMPKIGCGLDRLNIDEVKDLIHEVFIGSNVKIRMYII